MKIDALLDVVNQRMNAWMDSYEAMRRDRSWLALLSVVAVFPYARLDL